MWRFDAPTTNYSFASLIFNTRAAPCASSTLLCCRLASFTVSSIAADNPGLSEQEAARRLTEFGPNLVPEERPQVWRQLLVKFWAPVPWMLELTIAIQVSLGKTVEAAVMAALLLVNAALSFIQEHRADTALAILRRRLAVGARVFRDEHWRSITAESLVPGDLIRLRMGDLTPADVNLSSGTILVDQSALTGESLPVEVTGAQSAYAGGLIKRGEATGVVTSTGARTRFGKTAELVRTARTVSHMQETILAIVRALVTLDLALIVVMTIFALATHMQLMELVPFALILLVASVPVALPATFTLATALGARELAASGVLVTRLSAIEEAASMDVLAADKTGTITENRLTLHALHPYAPFDEASLLRLAALASDEASQDPIEMALLEAARSRGISSAQERLRFIPFDPSSKRTEVVIREDGRELLIVKGAPRTVATLVRDPQTLQADLEQLAAAGGRVLAVAAGPVEALSLAGLIGLADPPREDSAEVIGRLQALGVRVVMITGDGLNTARNVAVRVGLGGRACRRDELTADARQSLDQFDVFAGVFPEDKFSIVRGFQRAAHVTGMTGDGVNDAPALKQAEVGVAVANATDVAKAAASIVLTNPGLSDVVAAVVCSRRIHRRMLTYTLNKIVKTLELSVFLSIGVIATGTFVITPLLMVLLLFTNDFVTMSIATDRVTSSQAPQKWHIPALMRTAGIIAAAILLLSFAVLYVGIHVLRLALPELQTLVFVMLVFNGQGVVYLVRERRHLWASLPSPWLLFATAMDILAVAVLATRGIFMAPIPLRLVIALGLSVALFVVALDCLKVRLWPFLMPDERTF